MTPPLVGSLYEAVYLKVEVPQQAQLLARSQAALDEFIFGNDGTTDEEKERPARSWEVSPIPSATLMALHAGYSHHHKDS